MTEIGGATTQSGILYQNSVAALYLGRLCDPTERPNSQIVTCVRVETLDHVDDTVVTFADNHKEYIQAKTSISSNSDAWRGVWRDFDKQFCSEKFQRGKDRLVLQIGEPSKELNELQGLCERACDNENYSEWQSRLNVKQRTLLEKITPNLSPEMIINEKLQDFFKHIDVRFWSLKHIEEDLLPYWIPESNKLPHELYRLFRDRIGGKARQRGLFTAHQLRKSLKDENPEFHFLNSLKIEKLRKAVKQSSSLLRHHKHTIANTNEHILRGVVSDVVEWLLQNEGHIEKNVAMLLDQAGMGKTVVMRDILCDLEETDIDVLAIKADQQLSDITGLSEISTKLNLPQSVGQSVETLAKLGRTVVLIDQIDALSLSLAHDQKTLDIVLDLVARLRRIPNVRILISCRIFDRNSDPRLKRIDVESQFTLQELTDEEIKPILTKLQIDFDNLTAATKHLLRTPLHLDLFVFALEENPYSFSHAQDISSLQELYNLIWENVILKPEVGSPTATHRIQALYKLTDYMDNEQRISAPLSLTRVSPELNQAAKWLASIGILIPGNGEWTFLHQTFFDYCYARHFVEQGGDVVETILASNQGVFERPKLVQLMSYLRGLKQDHYIYALQTLLNSTKLRFHLKDLLWGWFGSLTNPTDEEWIIAQQILFNSENRVRLLIAMQGNVSWFERTRPIVKGWLARDVDFLDTEVIRYLTTLVNIAQAEIANLLQPYIGRSTNWNQRITLVLSRIRKWQTTEAIVLFEQIFYKLTSPDRFTLHQIEEVAKAHPSTGCKLIRFLFDTILQNFLKSQEEAEANQGEHYFSTVQLFDELQSWERSVETTLKIISEAEPKQFVETMIPWLEQVLSLAPTSDKKQPFFKSDALSHNWYRTTFRLQLAFVHSLIAALIELAKEEPETFRPLSTQLAKWPTLTPQKLLAHVYQAVPDTYYTDAYEFLLEDSRRFNLGDNQQYDSRQVIRAIYPYLSSEQRSELEKQILSFFPIYKSDGIAALRWRGIEQYRLLYSIPIEYLTSDGVRHLHQLRRKFPDEIISEQKPVTSWGGAVGSPISEDIARKMSDEQWLRAMQKYQKGRTHKDILKGGADQLARVLQNLIKEDPARFYKLSWRLPDDADDAYVNAFLNGIAESDAPVAWFFEIVRRFAGQNERNIKRQIAWAIEKGRNYEVPEDILQILYDWVYAPGGGDAWWSQDENHDNIFSTYLNSERGSAFGSLMRVFDSLRTDEALKCKWNLLEYAATDQSTALRLGAIHELTYMLQYDHNRAIELFERLLDNHSVLIASSRVREFLYWAFNKNFVRLSPHILAMMAHQTEDVQEQGAQLACIAALSTSAMESPKARQLAELMAEQALTGPPSLRRGAAHIYAHNIASSAIEVCKQKLKTLLDDEDEKVREKIDHMFFRLQGDYFFPMRDFIEDYASTERHEFEHEFAVYLYEHGLLDAEWTLMIVEKVISRDIKPNRWLWGTEELIRLVLRIYTSPMVNTSLKKRAMDVFDLLMEKHSGEAQKVLTEWDRR